MGKSLTNRRQPQQCSYDHADLPLIFEFLLLSISRWVLIPNQLSKGVQLQILDSATEIIFHYNKQSLFQAT